MDNHALLRRVQVRLAQQTDLQSLEWQGELIHFRRLFSDAYEQVQLGAAEIWLAELSRFWPGSDILIGQLILSLRFTSWGYLESAYMYGFRVKEQYRSQGVGSLLLKRVENTLYTRGCRILTLNVARDNPDARRMYERNNFQVVGEDEGHWFYTDHLGILREVHEPAWRMEKSLI